MIAIAVLLVLYAVGGQEQSSYLNYLIPVIGLPLLIGVSFVFVKYILLRLIARFDRYHEYIFLLSIGWCLAMAVVAETAGLSAEMGAFVAGVALATSPISQYIATNLKTITRLFPDSVFLLYRC